MKLKLLFLLLLSVVCKSQITFTEVKKVGDTATKTFKYDGKSEFLGNLSELFPDDALEYYMKSEKKAKDLSNYYKQYIGYDFYFLGKPQILENKVTKKYIFGDKTFLTKIYNPICKKCNEGNAKTYLKYDDVVNDSLKTYTDEYKILDYNYMFPKHLVGDKLDYSSDINRITYLEGSNKYQDEYSIRGKVWEILNKKTNDTVFVEDLDSNILFLPHFNFLKEILDGKKLIYLTHNGVAGAYNDLDLKDLLTDSRITLKNGDVLNSKVELLRNNAVYDLKDSFNEDSREKKDLYHRRFSFHPFIVLTTTDNKKFAVDEKEFSKVFFRDKNRIIEYNDYLKEIEYSKLAKLEQQKTTQKLKEKQQQEKLEKFKNLKIKYGEKIATSIMKNQVEVGMTKPMCDESLGKPYETKTLIRENLKYEVVYYYGGYVLYFFNNELKQIEY